MQKRDGKKMSSFSFVFIPLILLSLIMIKETHAVRQWGWPTPSLLLFVTVLTGSLSEEVSFLFWSGPEKDHCVVLSS